MTIADSAFPPLLLILITGTVTGLLGLAEDVRGLPIRVRAAVQFLLGGGLTLLILLPDLRAWLWVPLAALFFAAHVNFTNFMDGVNAISALHAVVVGGTYAALGMMNDLSWLTLAGTVIAVSFAAFLPWNLTPPGMFLGDVGSYLLGGLVASTAIVGIAEGLNPLLMLAPLSVYWFDTVSTLARRALRGEAIFEAHRSHAYQRLTATGMSHLQSAGTVAGFTLVASAAALLVDLTLIPWPVGLLAVLAIGTLYVSLPRFRGDQLPPKPSYEIVSPPPVAAVEVVAGWHPKKWAVVGATGFIGSAVTRHLRDSGAEVVEVTAPRLSLDPSVRDGHVVNQLANNLDLVDLVSKLSGADVIVNAAGLASPDGSGDDALFGANALLPLAVARAADLAGVRRTIHLSSAAVQGHRPRLDSSQDVAPFSPYSCSKALGEAALLSAVADGQFTSTGPVIIRATSVQGAGRATTASLRRVARSAASSVASPGDAPTVVSSVDGLVRFVQAVGSSTSPLPRILLQPWEGLSVKDVLELAGGRPPKVLPRAFCLAMLGVGRAVGKAVPRVAGIVRRVELMWLGQDQERSPLPEFQAAHRSAVEAVLRGSAT
ncbi:MAG: NAD-dependent epimerase/dehydratase family protein [Propionibacteriaceae bacterium]|nr:NAD-dependent epimerase/dehydratase family protein [Propionibacteriaceae bacterium]